jgi:YbbR domain-containing protein
VQSGKTVQVAGPESLLKKIGKITAVVNVSGMRSDKTVTATLHVYDKNEEEFLESQMDRIQIKDAAGVLLSDNQVDVSISIWEIMNDIPVIVETSGTPAEGYRISGITTVPVTVNLLGTQEALARLDGKVVLKDPISVEGATETLTVDVDLSETLEEEEDIRFVSDTDPTVTVTIQIEKTGDRTISVPLSSLELLNRPEGMTLTFSPADAISVGIHSEDESVYSIGTDDIRGTVDLGVCAEAGSYEIPVEIELPDGYELVSDVVIVVTSEAEVQENEVSAEE